MFGISGTELVLIAVFVLIIFGPDKIPEIARTVGKAVATFKRVQEDTERLIKAEMFSSDSRKRLAGSADRRAAQGRRRHRKRGLDALRRQDDDDDEEEEE